MSAEINPLMISAAMPKGAVAHDPKRIPLAAIKKAVCRRFFITEAELLSDSRKRCWARPRQLAMVLCRDLTGHSLPSLGRQFGGRDHSTVHHGCASITAVIKRDPVWAEHYSAILLQLTLPPPANDQVEAAE